MFDSLKVYEKIRRYPIISFDIFDTLVKRNVIEPRDIFDIVEESFNRRHPRSKIMGFREKRIQAEQAARQHCIREEVALQQIYDQIDIDLALCRELMRLETETELQYCQPNYILKGIYEQCIADGHVVIITSDMYLPRDIIVQILHKCGYTDYKKLYLSSEVGLRKQTGNLFEYMIRDLGVSGKDIIHIGDRKKADNLIPRLKGMGSLYIDRKHLNTEILKEKDFLEADSFLFPFLNNNLPKYHSESDLFRWGYEAFGPLLLGFTTWVHEQLSKNKIEKTFFLARDMYLVIDAYRKLYGSENVEYLEVSRKSLRAAYVKKKNCLAAVFDTMTRRTYTVGDILTFLGIDVTEIHDISIDLSVKISSRNASDKRFSELNRTILNVLNNQKDYTKDYLEQMGLFSNERIAIIDIGWHGSIQNMMEVLLGKPLLGLYFGNTVRNYFPAMIMQGYWFNFKDEKMAGPYLSMTFILETILFPKIGTTIGYGEKEGIIRPEYKACEIHNFDKIEQFQNGAKKFMEDYLHFNLGGQHIEKTESVKAFQKVAFEPTLSQAKALANIPCEDGKIFYVASARSFGYYLLHPVRLFKDYKAARWKEAFVKQVLPILPQTHPIVVMGRNLKNSWT